MTTSEPQVPDPERLKFVQQLCDLRKPYEITPESDELFLKAMQEMIDWHSQNNEFYRKVLELRKFKASDLKSVEDSWRVPFVLANFFKLHEERSVAPEKITLHLTSSGTTGQKSQIFFDDWTLRSAQRMIDFIFDYYGWRTPDTKSNYLLYTYETEADSKLGTAYTDNFLCKYSPVNRAFAALRLTGSSHEFDIYGCIERLREYEKEKLPVRIFGFPAFLHFTLERMRALKMPPLKLSEKSLVFLGGGWKGHADKAIDKLELYRHVNEQLGIPDGRIRDGFGSVEHCVPYIECVHHQFHVPVWSRVYIRDLKTLAPLPYGEKGFLHFVSPYISSVPAVSVLMGDLASLYDADSCPCELKTPYFVIHGRAGLSRNKSCAVAAAELASAGRLS